MPLYIRLLPARFAAVSIALVGCCVFAAPEDSAVPVDHPAASPQKGSTSDAGALVKPRVFFVEPKDGAVVSSPFKVRFGLTGMKIAKAGAAVPGSGHHHLVIDGLPAAKGVVVGKDASHLHYGDGQTEATLTLPPGKHSLTLQFADGSHASYGEGMSSTITISVR